MVLGKNKNTGNMLLRGWHVEGWSVKEKKNTKNVWRLFKTVNIKTMMFTGDFFRLPPSGYRRNDRVMTETTIIAADFNTIRRNQQNLLNAGKIQVEQEQEIGFADTTKIIKIDIRNTDTQFDFTNPFRNNLVKRDKIKELKMTFLKSIFGNQYIAIIGGSGTPNRTVKVFEDNTILGTYKVIGTINMQESYKTKKAFEGPFEIFQRELRKISVGGTKTMDLYTFNKLILP
jgi:hypothetical protein